MIQIVVMPLGRGQFEVGLGGRLILTSSRQPLLDAARVLLAEGVAPDTRIGMRHAGTPHITLSSTVGKAARLTVDEYRTTFTKWKAHPRSAVAPPMRFGEEAAPTLAPEAFDAPSSKVAEVAS